MFSFAALAETGIAITLSNMNINNIIDEIEAFSRLTYKSVYIIDYYKRNFLYVSQNPLFLCGLSPEEVKEFANKVGYPVILKATAGGGGKGKSRKSAGRKNEPLDVSGRFGGKD